MVDVTTEALRVLTVLIIVLTYAGKGLQHTFYLIHEKTRYFDFYLLCSDTYTRQSLFV